MTMIAVNRNAPIAYPVPPKPEKAGKDQEMEDVMSNLESLIGGRA